MDLVSCFIHEIQRTAEPNNHQDYSANQSGIQNYRLPFYLRTLRRFLLIKKQNLLVPALLYSTGGRLEAAPGMGRVEEMTGGRNNRILGEELLKIKSLPAHRHKELRFL